MSEITLITGGSRSGKSSFAQNLAEQRSAEGNFHRIFIATCPTIDHEMADRIERHKKERCGGNWQTIEEECHLAETISSLPETPAVILIDCITLWINNLLYHAEADSVPIDDFCVQKKVEEVVEEIHNSAHRCIIVTNEVGLGIIPDNPSARQYRDLVGTANQCLGYHAKDVVLVSCGIPLYLKS